jgi:hypothetical protein
MDKNKIKELIPLALITIGLLYAAIVATTTDIVLSLPHWLGYGLTGLILITYFFKKIISNILLGITLILGLFNVVSFLPYSIIVGGGITPNAFDSEFTIAFQLFSFIVLLAFLYAHGGALMKWLNKDGL